MTDFALDRTSLQVAGALALAGAWPHAAPLHHLQKRLVVVAADDQRQVADRVANMVLNAVPFDAAKIGVDHQQLIRRDDPFQDDRHGLAVLAGAVIDHEQRAAIDQGLDGRKVDHGYLP